MWLHLLLGLFCSRVFAQTNYTNPNIWQDLPDIDLIRIGDAYYYSASTFQYFPGAVILRSYDIVNWEYLSHSVPNLDFQTTEAFNLESGSRYNQGIFASFFNYRKSTDTFYWGGCIVGDGNTYVYTAPTVEGPWTQSSTINQCLYDAVLAPIYWDEEGWPHVEFVDNQWATTYPLPLPERPVKPITGTDNFETFGTQYEWNHNPDNTAWDLNNGLELRTATVTDDFFRARNTLTHRILGPVSTATIELDYSQMADGDRTGLVLFRYAAAWIGVVKDGDRTKVAMVNNIMMVPDDGWHTVDKGEEIESAEISGGSVWLRLEVGVNSLYNEEGRFSYSTDGVTFQSLGEPHQQVNNGILHFLGYRYGLFNYATLARGGAVTVKSFGIHE
ncbi:hypothetical protein K4K56_005572 [Colletotrichum sp. SAR 10_98]|nr:hypothetical protein K4K56_005572 [Colletotrichum sp. SAR 10_98]